MVSTAGQTNQRGPGLSGSIHEEAHLGLSQLIQSIFEGVEAGSSNYMLVQSPDVYDYWLESVMVVIVIANAIQLEGR